MQNINNILNERNMIMESLSFEYFDPLDYLYESIDILLEDDNLNNNNNQNNNNQNNNNNTNANNNNDNLKQNDKRVDFDIKKTISNMIKVLLEWFGRLKDAMGNFFKGFRNVNHKKIMKEIFTDPNKHNTKIKVYDYVNLRNGVNNVTNLIKNAEKVFQDARKNKNPDLASYKQKITIALKMKKYSGSDLKASVYGCFIKNNKKIRITIGQLNEQIVSSYLLGAGDVINNIEHWKNDLKRTMEQTNNDIYQDYNVGILDKPTAKKFTTMLKTHTSTIEKICVQAMKCVKKGFTDFNRMLTKGNGTTDNIENQNNNNNNDNGGNNNG